ncbi:hypothetical protein QL285_093355 [Trifolium repens]|nr:hypothetical protein QL285_093355 [Trifolium repens]
MDHDFQRLQLPSKGSFTTMLLPGQSIGEVPLEFSIPFHNELNHLWQLWDNNGQHHTLTYAKNNIVPHLTDGWFALIMHFNVTEPTELIVTYYGGRSFRISIGKMLSLTTLYPSFHSHSTKPNFTTYFDVKLSKFAIESSQLTLHKDFGDYLRTNNFRSVLLCNEGICIVQAAIHTGYASHQIAEIGSGWKHFCAINGYQHGDTLRFKFTDRLASNLIHVFPI